MNKIFNFMQLFSLHCDNLSLFALGSIHAGIGLEQLSNLLSSMNIHPISNDLWAKRQEEIAPALSEVAKTSVSFALYNELDAAITAGEDNGINISVDGAWQSRGSGRSYNSASGHATAVGKHTGKCVGFALRSKACRKCRIAQKMRTVVIEMIKDIAVQGSK